MAKETDGRGRATMNEADIEYLRNINTRPGPNAGRSIDPSKPGPDDLEPHASAKDVATKIASRPALARLIDTGALQFSEMCDLRDDIEKALCLRPDASAGLIEAAAMAEECASECLEDRKAPLSAYALRDFAKVLRARATNRNRK
jgi:hypothetical protein